MEKAKSKEDLESRIYAALCEFLVDQAKIAKIPKEDQVEYMLVLLMQLIAKDKAGKLSLESYVIFKANEA